MGAISNAWLEVIEGTMRDLKLSWTDYEELEESLMENELPSPRLRHAFYEGRTRLLEIGLIRPTEPGDGKD